MSSLHPHIPKEQITEPIPIVVVLLVHYCPSNRVHLVVGVPPKSTKKFTVSCSFEKAPILPNNLPAASFEPFFANMQTYVHSPKNRRICIIFHVHNNGASWVASEKLHLVVIHQYCPLVASIAFFITSDFALFSFDIETWQTFLLELSATCEVVSSMGWQK